MPGLDLGKSCRRRRGGCEQVVERDAGIHCRLDRCVGGMSQFYPGQVCSAAIRAVCRCLHPLCGVQRASRQIAGIVGNKHRQRSIGAVVSLDGRARIAKELHFFAGNASQRVPLLNGRGAIGGYGDFRHAAIVVWGGGCIPVGGAHAVHAGSVFLRKA